MMSDKYARPTNMQKTLRNNILGFEKIKYYLRSFIYGPSNGLTLTIIILFAIFHIVGNIYYGRGWEANIIIKLFTKAFHNI